MTASARARTSVAALLSTACLLGILVATPSAFGQAAAEQYIPEARPEGSSSAGADVAGGGLGSVAGTAAAPTAAGPNVAAATASGTGSPLATGGAPGTDVADSLDPSTPLSTILAAVLPGVLLIGLGIAVLLKRWLLPAQS